MNFLIPAIFADVDGVLIEINNQIPKVKKTLQILNKPLGFIDSEKYGENNGEVIPLLELTNRGGMTEQQTAEWLNGIFDLKEDDEFRFQQNNLIICHTALKKLWANEFKGKLIMIIGFGWEDVIAESGATYISLDEYLDIYPELVPNSTLRGSQLQAMEAVSKRLNIQMNTFQNDYLQIHGIFSINDCGRWEDSIQLILDLLSTEDGHISKSKIEKMPTKHIPIYSSSNDMQYKDEFRLNRLANGSFINVLQSTYKTLYNQDLEVICYGKPAQNQFEFSENYLRNEIISKETKISNIYMIGDNPQSDIRGANQVGWISILVKTGVWHGSEENDSQYPAKYVVDDFYEAIKLIFELEGISIKRLLEYEQ